MDKTYRSSEERLVPALSRAIQIMNLVSAPDQRLTISEIARHLSLPKSSVHGLCATLLSYDLLQKRDDQSFKLGPHIMRWSNAFTRTIDVTDEFLTLLDSEADIPGSTITLSVLNNREVVYVAARNTDRHPNLFKFQIGDSLPAAFTATGKAFLMGMLDSEVRGIYADDFPPPMTPHSVTDVEDLITELHGLRRAGYSIDREQVMVGMLCYGKTVLNGQNQPVAGVAISIPAETMTPQEEARIVSTLERFADVISRRMGSGGL
ncbi:IclR family transcriptional regulator [Roseovarius sp. D0-M9]|uniref:IclR family transcriptional regulator n=1 Tax=Roseovarius sp. D0-M9 TaxID=3127117 RepID=UPI00301000B7